MAKERLPPEEEKLKDKFVERTTETEKREKESTGKVEETFTRAGNGGSSRAVAKLQFEK